MGSTAGQPAPLGALNIIAIRTRRIPDMPPAGPAAATDLTCYPLAPRSLAAIAPFWSTEGVKAADRRDWPHPWPSGRRRCCRRGSRLCRSHPLSCSRWYSPPKRNESLSPFVRRSQPPRLRTVLARTAPARTTRALRASLRLPASSDVLLPGLVRRDFSPGPAKETGNDQHRSSRRQHRQRP